MTMELPPFLRLHVADESPDIQSSISTIDPFTRYAAAFEVATGWSLRWKSSLGNTERKQRFEIVAAPTPENGESATPARPIERRCAVQLAELATDVFTELEMLRSAIRCREADLAAGIPVSPRLNEAEHLADRLEAILKNGAAAVRCCAAGLYMLDDSATELKLRAGWGLPPDRFLEPARPLATSFAELESLLGHAIVLEDASLLPHWKVPEPFPAAICFPVSSPTSPLGTVWFFADRIQEFSDREVRLAEILAGCIAAELQREVLLRECMTAKQADRQTVRAVQWQQDHLPTIKPDLDGWDVAGWTDHDDAVMSSFFDWFIAPDGSFSSALGSCDDPHIESALNLSALQAGIRSHADYRHTSAAMIQRVNDMIWNSSAGGNFASLFYGQADPDIGAIEFSIAGSVQVIVIQGSDTELVNADPLPLGIEPALDPERHRYNLAVGDLVVVLNTSSTRPSFHLELARQIRAARDSSADELVQRIRSIDAQVHAALVLRSRLER